MTADIVEINRKISFYEQRLRDARWEADQLPNRSPWQKPDDECPRGHKYPENPRLYPVGGKSNWRMCEICRKARSHRMHLAARLKKWEQRRKEYAW